jgi:hypothetical protein
MGRRVAVVGRGDLLAELGLEDCTLEQ